MPAEIYEDTLDLNIGLIEAEMLSPDGGEAHRQSMPYPRLKPLGGRVEPRSFRTAVLENEFLRATFVPGLGGRLLSLFDKRTRLEILPQPAELLPRIGGSRGAELDAGLQITLGPEDRPNSLGEMFVLPSPAGDEDQPAGVWFFELTGTGLGLHFGAFLAPDRAELTIEVRTHNRTFRPVRANGGIRVSFGGSFVKTDAGFLAFDPERDAGLVLTPGEVPLDAASFDGHCLRVQRGPDAAKRTLSPRQMETWSLSLTPVSGLKGITAASPEAACHVDTETLRIQAAERRAGHKVLLLTPDGQTLEAPVDLHPERVLELSLVGLPTQPVALVVQDPAKHELLRWEASSPALALGRWEAALPADAAELLRTATVPAFSGDASDEALRRATLRVDTRSTAWTLLAHRSLKEGNAAEAAERLEKALLFNAEDPLAWWLRAVAMRLAGEDGDERPEILNAHFLAPLEPALRAERFLSANEPLGREPSPLLKPLAQIPEAFVEVACLLLESGLNDQAQRWIDEALRHVDLAMLRYLLADAFLRASRMSVEAAQQMAAAAKLPFGPPYPYRDAERQALTRLHEAFPEDAAVKAYLGLAKLGETPPAGRA